ncbi:MAG: DEAD/DEAH box helicase [Verrucomicrobia bacterium]|nr:MAG: DEAD/DEAH box helicase [Verrucomicrobiota bacterium]TAE88172.1 MAG: DEAD/DEAH box helicase [Verrucomicrobiota bacterium]TAF26056.1 MAG: DEAD/DEAH box helicase [Verrucomicrobiota bacterium]TAF41019.1 MAG: DEAD/DEAH box helicase [Verrucomicrobiota bacterium]
MTPYHAKYYAHELTRTGGDGVDRLGRALFDATVTLNPHQIEAALFALRSPLSKGVLLADEVGLGKTIEAGLVLCQSWAEGRRRLLIITPASLRKQWALELHEKFNLPSIILDAHACRELRKSGHASAFEQSRIVITSYHYAARMAAEIQPVPWDLVVMDEAHKLRNCHRESNRLGQAIKKATADRKKILLTATPLQNSLVELFGLASLIDERLFGDLPTFRTQFANAGGDLPGLRERLAAFCHRTLRSQVLEYVKYTARQLLTQPFTPTEDEHTLYETVSRYLQRDDCYALPQRQRHLIVLLVRKVLSSSPRALAGTLEMMRDRLLRIQQDAKNQAGLFDQLLAGDELDADLLDELLEDAEDAEIDDDEETPATNETAADEEIAIDPAKLKKEIAELDDYIRWARGIGVDTKSRTLLKALDIGFAQMAGMNPPAPRKAVIFTESRRTQAFLKDFLEANGHAGKIVLFNGSNNDPDSKRIYENWCAANRDSGRMTGSRPVDSRTALIDAFRDSAEILIATEAAAEGINLQFCALVINFDLPWNPQRIEQRIGRCHRYGQQHDVVVINFLNQRNEADLRVHQLLETKFHLFSTLFDNSDDVLGLVDGTIDFERRVLEIYQQCRSADEINAAFDALQNELKEQIESRMKETRKLLLDHFDEDVHERLQVRLDGAKQQLDRIGRLFWALTRFELKDHAAFDDEELAFDLHQSPITAALPGHYRLVSKGRANIPGDFLYRLNHPLGEHTIAQGKGHPCPLAELTFEISAHPTKVSVVEQLKGRSGWLTLQHLRIDSLEREDHLLFSAFDDEGRDLDQETCERLFSVAGTSIPSSSTEPPPRLAQEAARHVAATLNRSLETNHRHFQQARDQLDRWAEDMELASQKQLEDLKRQIRDLQRRSRQAPTLQEEKAMQDQILKLEQQKRRQRQRIFEIEDEIEAKRKTLVAALEARLQQKTLTTPLFTVRWSVL